MKVNTLKYSQILPISLDRAWNFLSSPKNLKLITPKSMNFNISEWDNRDSYPGQIIQYTVEPIFGIKLKWVTEITHLEKNKYFATMLKLLLLHEVKGILGTFGVSPTIQVPDIYLSEEKLTSSLSGYYSDRSLVYLSVDIDLLTTNNINTVSFRRELIRSISGLLLMINKHEILTIHV